MTISQVHLGVGYLELPQLEFSVNRPMTQEMLRTQRVYLLDTYTDVFVWVGAHSDRSVFLILCLLHSGVSSLLYSLFIRKVSVSLLLFLCSYLTPLQLIVTSLEPVTLTRLLRAAAAKLSTEILKMIKRPTTAIVNTCFEGEL